MSVHNYNKSTINYEYVDVLCKCCSKEIIMYIDECDQCLCKWDESSKVIYLFDCPFCDFVFV